MIKKVVALILLLCVFSISLLPSFNCALAEDSFCCVKDEGVFLFSSQTLDGDSILFEIPKTYFVKIVEEKESCFFVEYAESKDGFSKVFGYVKKEGLEKSSALSPLFPNLKISTIANTKVFNDPSLNSEVAFSLFKGQEVNFYGKSPDENLIFISFAGNFGYADISNFESFNIQNHPNFKEPVPSITPSTSTERPSPTPSTTDIAIETTVTPSENELSPTLQAILLTFIAIPTFIMVYLLFKSPKKKE